MHHVGKLPKVSSEIQNAFLEIWVESKVLPLRVGDRPALARALRLLMPGNYQGPSLTLYRGANWNERRWHRYQFCWSTKLDVARKFAERRRSTGEGAVVLRTVASARAVLLIRPAEGWYDEGEVVIDPFALGVVEVVERLKSNVEVSK
jgi:hypothetical protein